MNNRIFEDRRAAGRSLATEIRRCKLKDPIVIGLARGGIPVAYEVALAIDAPLDVLVVRKLGAPFQPELAIGAIASGGVRVFNEQLLDNLPSVNDSDIEKIVAKESQELSRREKLYRGDQPYPEFRDKDVLLVDDGMATGATMRAAVKAVKHFRPANIFIAVPTASAEAVRLIANIGDKVICLDTPHPFHAVGNYYRRFGQTTDEEVRSILDDARAARSSA